MVVIIVVIAFQSIVKSHLHKICMWNACIDKLNSTIKIQWQ